MPVDLSTFFAGAYDDATPGLGAIVNRAGRIVYEQAIGLANLEHAVPIAGDTVFNLGSLAKQFTGLAILQLYAAGGGAAPARAGPLCRRGDHRAAGASCVGAGGL